MPYVRCKLIVILQKQNVSVAITWLLFKRLDGAYVPGLFNTILRK